MILTSVAIVSYNMFWKLSDFWFYCLYCLTADFVDLIAFFLRYVGSREVTPASYKPLLIDMIPVINNHSNTVRLGYKRY